MGCVIINDSWPIWKLLGLSHQRIRPETPYFHILDLLNLWAKVTTWVFVTSTPVGELLCSVYCDVELSAQHWFLYISHSFLLSYC